MHSPWKHVGRDGLVNSLSTRQLVPVELEALSLGLKFDTGKHARPLFHYYTANSRRGGKWTEDFN